MSITLPQKEILYMYLDTLAQLATGYKRKLSAKALVKFRVSQEEHGVVKGKNLFDLWCSQFPGELFEYEELTPTDISRMNAFLSGSGRLLNKFMPDLKSVDIHDTREPLSVTDQAERISKVFQNAGVPQEALETFLERKGLSPPSVSSVPPGRKPPLDS